MIASPSIAGPMHWMASRLGLRDGQAYTAVLGAIAALALALAGLPPVLRGVDVPVTEHAAALQPIAPSPAPTIVVGDEATKRSTPSIPALAPAPPTRETARATTRRSAVPSAAPTPGSATTVPTDRSVGDLRVLADVGAPGSPDGVAVAGDGTVYVATDTNAGGPSQLLAFAPDGARRGSWAVPDQPEDRVRGLTGVAISGDDTVLLTDAATARVLRLDPRSSSLVVVASVPDVPACGVVSGDGCEPGLVDNPPMPTDVAVSPDGLVAVTDHGQSIVWALDGSEVAPLVLLTDRSPTGGPIASSFERSGRLVVAVSSRLASFPPGLPALFRIPVDDAGDAGTPELLVDLADGEVPGDLVASATDRVYVTIPSVGVVADIGIDQGDRIDLVAGDDGYQAPTGVALRDRSLLLTDPSDFGGPGLFGRLFALTLNDRPVPRGAS